MRKTISYLIAVAVFLMVLLPGCAGALNEELGPWPSYTKPIDDFKIYTLNSGYIMLVWTANRTQGIYSCSTDDGNYQYTATDRNRFVSDWYTSRKWRVFYYLEESGISYQRTEDKEAAPLSLSLKCTASNGKEVFSWSGLPAALCSHIDGAYIVKSSYQRLTYLPPDAIPMSAVSSGTYQSTVTSSSNTWYLFVKVGDCYYNLGAFKR